MMRKRVSTAFIGHIHRDPITFIVLLIMVEMARQQSIPVVFCMEDYSGLTYDDWIKGSRRTLESTTGLFLNPAIQLLIKHDLSRPYLVLSDQPKVDAVIAERMTNRAFINTVSDAIMRRVACPEAVNFVQYIKEAKIPLAGIEGKREQRQQMLDSIITQDDYLKREAERINVMSSNIITDGLSQLPGDGIVIVLTGVNHVHRLAANFWLRYTSDSALHNKYDISIFPFKAFSPYVEDGIPAHIEVEALSRKNDSATILKLYQQIPCPVVRCNDMKPDIKDAKELPTDLKPIMDKMFQHLAPSMVSIVVPKYEEKIKKPVIDRFKGNLVKVDKNHYATISINQVDLNEMKKDTREILGIQRFRVKLEKEQYDLLKQDKAVTIEKSSEANKFFLTFPDDRRPLVDKVCNKWALIQNNYRIFEDKLTNSVKAYKAFLKIQQQAKIKKSVVVEVKDTIIRRLDYAQKAR